MGFIQFILASAVLFVAADTFTLPTGVYSPQATSLDIKELERQLNGGKRHTCSLKRSISPHNGTPNINQRWRNGIYFHPSSAWNSAQMTMLNAALAELNTHFCNGVFLWPQNSTPTGDYVEIIKGAVDSGCYADLGRQGGRQEMNLEESGCMLKDTIIHEAYHSLGIDHEHNREDRDDHIDVFIDNVEPANQYNFDKSVGFLTFNLSYDYLSIMHYDSRSFILDPNDEEMFSMLKKDGTQIGWNSDLTALDIAKLRALYNCS